MSDCLMCDVLCKERDEHWDAELAAKAEAASLRANLDVAVEEKRKAEARVRDCPQCPRCGDTHAEDDNCPNCRDDVWTKIEPPAPRLWRCPGCGIVAQSTFTGDGQLRCQCGHALVPGTFTPDQEDAQ